MRDSLAFILIIFFLSGCNERKKISCCDPVNPISVSHLHASDNLPEEINFLIKINDALERYKNKNFKYPAFKQEKLTNNKMFGNSIKYESQLFSTIKPYCDVACKELIENSKFKYKIGYISNGAQYKLIFFDNKLCESISSELPQIVNPQTDRKCLSIGFWTPRATYW